MSETKLSEVEVSHIQPSMCTAHEATVAAIARTKSGCRLSSATTWREEIAARSCGDEAEALGAKARSAKGAHRQHRGSDGGERARRGGHHDGVLLVVDVRDLRGRAGG